MFIVHLWVDIIIKSMSQLIWAETTIIGLP